jgi:hypothetical protein
VSRSAEAVSTPVAQSEVLVRPAFATSRDAMQPLVRLVGGTDAAAKDITFETVQFDIKADGAYEEKMLTDTIRDLAGKRVRIRGWIEDTSVFRRTGIKEFILIRHNGECCFGPGAVIYDCMQVNLKAGESTEFTTRPITIEGTFTVEPLEEGGRLWVLYRLKDAVVE